ncbi:MAG: TPM domain-containing protein [Chitinophagaceae bacterium]
MGIFSRYAGSKFLSKQEISAIQQAIGIQEKRTSGEIRLYLESRCKFMDPVERAKELFTELQMHQTKERNAVLIYIAHQDRQLAIWGDTGIHEILGTDFWNAQVHHMILEFGKGNFAEGISKLISEVGDALHVHFPFDKDSDTNELSDDIIFGK